ncbi:hypothetical protein F4777DRAFT_400235 [Nemania sp. FL0916]|nr:hypothetical protein F4777DRAFT_400235 [Nemania sp. FL0916]
MRTLASDRSGSGFAPVPQIDDGDHNHDETTQHQASSRGRGRGRLREQVQQLIQQTPPFAVSHNTNPPSAKSSPALSDSSDTSLLNQDYLALPIQRFDEVDLGDGRGGYVEEVSYYGPEVAGNNPIAYDSSLLKKAEGIEVRIQSYPLALSPAGLCTDDDQLPDVVYSEPEEDNEKSIPIPSRGYNYKPVPLRWWFVLLVFGGLVAFLALGELALRKLPNASEMNDTLPLFQNISEIRRRSSSQDDNDKHDWQRPPHSSSTQAISSTETVTSETKTTKTTTTRTTRTSSTAHTTTTTSTKTRTSRTSTSSTTSSVSSTSASSKTSPTTTPSTTSTPSTPSTPSEASTPSTPSAPSTPSTTVHRARPAHRERQTNRAHRARQA